MTISMRTVDSTQFEAVADLNVFVAEAATRANGNNAVYRLSGTAALSANLELPANIRLDLTGTGVIDCNGFSFTVNDNLELPSNRECFKFTGGGEIIGLDGIIFIKNFEGGLPSAYGNSVFFGDGKLGVGRAPDARLQVHEVATSGTLQDVLRLTTQSGGVFSVKASDLASATPDWILAVADTERLRISNTTGLVSVSVSLKTAGRFKATGSSTDGLNGVGPELYYTSGAARLIGYDRDEMEYTPFVISGEYVDLQVSGTKVLSVNADRTITLLPGSQSYDIGNRGNALYFAGRAVGAESAIDVFNADGATGGNSVLRVFGLGTPEGTTDSELFSVFADSRVGSRFVKLTSTANGAGVRMKIVLTAANNNTQLVLNTDDSVTMSGPLSVASINVGGLVLSGNTMSAASGGISINPAAGQQVAVGGNLSVSGNTTLGNAKTDFTTVNGFLTVTGEGAQDYKLNTSSSIFVLQGQNVDQPTTLMLVPKTADAGDDCQIMIQGYGSAASADYERLVLQWENSPAEYRIMTFSSGTGVTARRLVLGANGNTSQIVLNPDNSVTMSGSVAIAGIVVEGSEIYMGAGFDVADGSNIIDDHGQLLVQAFHSLSLESRSVSIGTYSNGDVLISPNGTGQVSISSSLSVTGNVTGANLAITNWNTAYSNSHTHANKATYLDPINQVLSTGSDVQFSKVIGGFKATGSPSFSGTPGGLEISHSSNISVITSVDRSSGTVYRPIYMNATGFHLEAQTGAYLYVGDPYGGGADLEVTVSALRSAGAVGFYGTTGPATQPSHIANPSGGATIDAESRAAISAILSLVESFGMTATS